MRSRERNLIFATVLIVLLGCKREERGFRVDPPAANAIYATRLTELQPGTPTTNQPVKNDYEDNAYGMSEGQRLYTQMNCVGCHSHGGGGMGPALMDDKWIYGSNPENIFATIVEGRPNGMPSFRGKIPDYQVWQIAAYVRSMSGQASKIAAVGREDHMQGKQPENSAPTQPPRPVTEPKTQ